MHPRIPYVESNGTFTFPVDGTKFSFDPQSKSDRRRAMDDLNNYALPVIQQLDELAGKQLTHRELLHGLKKTETRDIAERIRDEQNIKKWRESQQTKESRNPWDDAFEAIDNAKGVNRRESHRKRRQQLRDEWEKEPEPKPEMSKEQKKAIEAAQKQLFRLKYDPAVSRKQMEDAEFRLEVAKAGDLERYENLTNEFFENQKEAVADQTSKLDEKIGELQKEKERLNSFIPQPEPEPRYNADGVRVLSREETLEFDKRQAELREQQQQQEQV